MSKIIVVGHSSVDIAPLNEALEFAGVSQAEYSSKSPQEIDEIISTISQDGTSFPVIWNGLALDLLVDNIHHSLWGWSHSQALHALEYWKSIDPKFTFILSYDSPIKILIEETDDEKLESKLQEWITYNQKLLQFYLDNRANSVLLHQSQFNLDIQTGMALLESGIKGLSYDKKEDVAEELLHQHIDNGKLSMIMSEKNVEISLQEFLLESVVQAFPEVINLYERLQAVSDIPLKEQNANKSPLEAWKSFNRFQQQFQDEKDELAHKLLFLEEENNQEQDQLRVELISSKEEGSLLLDQLHIAQAEVESLFEKSNRLMSGLNEKESLLNQKNEFLEKINQRVAELEAQKAVVVSKQEEAISQLNKVQSESALSAQIVKKLSAEKTELEEYRKKVEKENLELLQQTHFAQEELEKIYLESRQKELEKQQGPFGAGDRIKNQLDYRIGATLIENSKSISGYLLMPFKLNSSYREFKKDRQNLLKLPAIDTYQDYYDVSRVQGHLSYRLGNYFVKNIKKPWKWFVMPIQMRKIVKDFRSEKK